MITVVHLTARSTCLWLDVSFRVSPAILRKTQTLCFPRDPLISICALKSLWKWRQVDAWCLSSSQPNLFRKFQPTERKTHPPQRWVVFEDIWGSLRCTCLRNTTYGYQDLKSYLLTKEQRKQSLSCQSSLSFSSSCFQVLKKNLRILINYWRDEASARKTGWLQ